MKKRLFFVSIILILIFVGLRYNPTSFFSVKSFDPAFAEASAGKSAIALATAGTLRMSGVYKCIAPEILSSHYFSLIDNSLGHLIAENSSACEIIHQLKQQFPVLKKIVFAYRPAAIQVAMSVYEPVCCINNQTVLTCDNTMFPKDFFSETATQDVPKIVVMQEDMTNIPLLVSSLLHELPSDFNQRYDIEIVNDHYVRLIDKHEPNFIIIFTADQKKSSLLLAQCELVKHNIAERAGFHKGVKWMADTRFAHYIIAYKA